MAGADAHFVPIVTGLDDGTNIEIKSGLTEGQEVIIGTRSATSASSSAARPSGTQGANPMGALRGVSGGGR